MTVPALYDGDYTAVATVTDANGSVSPASNEDSFTIDRTEIVTPDAPVIAISEAQPDGLVNQTESSDGVQVQVTVPEDTVAGDVLTVTLTQPDGNQVEVVTEVPATWNGEDAIEVTVPAFFDGDYTAEATITNADGQQSPVSNSVPFALDKTAPGADGGDTLSEPAITIDEAQGDDIVDAVEASDGVQVQVEVPESSLVGDTITLTVTGPDGNQSSVTAEIPSTWDGSAPVEVTIPVDQVTLEGEYVAIATVTDEAGNVSDASNIENFIIDDGIDPLEAPVIDVAEADGDGIVDATEALDGVQFMTVPTGTAIGDTITRQSLNQTALNLRLKRQYRATGMALMQWKFCSCLIDGDYTAVATVTDANGDVSPASNEDAFTIDRTEIVVPDAPVLAIAEAEPDTLVSENEAADGVQVQITLPEGKSLAMSLT